MRYIVSCQRIIENTSASKTAAVIAPSQTMGGPSTLLFQRTEATPKAPHYSCISVKDDGHNIYILLCKSTKGSFRNYCCMEFKFVFCLSSQLKIAIVEEKPHRGVSFFTVRCPIFPNATGRGYMTDVETVFRRRMVVESFRK